MGISLGILFGIIAMIGWGISDFFLAKAVRKDNVLKVFVWSQIIGLLLFTLIFSLFFQLQTISIISIIIILISGFLGVISGLAFSKGLQIGYVSIITPVSAAAAVVTVFLSLIFLNQVLTSLQAGGIAIIILGTILTSFKYHDLIKLKLKNVANGVGYAIIAMIGWGILFFFIDMLVSDLGWFIPIFYIKILGVIYVLTYSGITKKNISFPKTVALFVVLSGILESIAFLSFGVGVSLEFGAVIAPIAFAFPIVAIILARIFFKEILELNQKIGVVAVLTGLVLLAM